MRTYLLLTTNLVLALLISGCLHGLPPSSNSSLTPSENQQKNGTTVTGLIHDSYSGLELWNGLVSLSNAQGQYTASIQEGAFELKDVTPGTYTLTIEKEFYQPLQRKLQIRGSHVSIEETMTPVFSSGELDLFARLVHAEAKGETYQGQVAVAATVLNRVLHPKYPSTLSGVINQVVIANGRRYYQYEPVLNGAIRAPASQMAKDAVSDALAGWDPSYNATGFFAPAKVGSRSWVWNRTPTTTIGNHRFFR